MGKWRNDQELREKKNDREELLLAMWFFPAWPLLTCRSFLHLLVLSKPLSCTLAEPEAESSDEEVVYVPGHFCLETYSLLHH